MTRTPVWTRPARWLRRPGRHRLRERIGDVGVSAMIVLVVGGLAFMVSLVIRNPNFTSSSAAWTPALGSAGRAGVDGCTAGLVAGLAWALWSTGRRLIAPSPARTRTRAAYAGVGVVAVIALMTLVGIAASLSRAGRTRANTATVAPAPLIVAKARPRPTVTYDVEALADGAPGRSIDDLIGPLDAGLADFESDDVAATWPLGRLRVAVPIDRPAAAAAPAVTVHEWDDRDAAAEEARSVVKEWLAVGEIGQARGEWWHPGVPLQKRTRPHRVEAHAIVSAETVRELDLEGETARCVIVTVRLTAPGPGIARQRDVEVWLSDDERGRLRIQRVVDPPE